LTVVKSASPSDAASFTVGQTITYSFVVTNTGNLTLANVTVDEGTFTGSGTLSAPVCPAAAASLPPGAQVTCTATYTVTQADVDAGKITNTATATGNPPSGPPTVSPPTTVTVPQPPAPAITVVKSATPGTITTLGETVTYSFLVTNTGNVTLTNATISEGTFTGSGTLSPPTCPAGASSLAPGAQVTCTATYMVTQADIDAGSITNTATATGTAPSGPPPVSPPSTATVPFEGVAKLGLGKTAHPVDVNHDGKINVGDRIEWTLLVSNLGASTITGISVSDPTAGKVTCPTTTLAPGKIMTCTTGAHTVTAADAAAGTVDNTAIAAGIGVGKPVSSAKAVARVPIEQAPAGPAGQGGHGGPGGLAKTGQSGIPQLVYTGLGLLLLGGLMMLVGLRRRRT
jgi:uncharacterized repeat protein (TIGR01451 family)